MADEHKIVVETKNEWNITTSSPFYLGSGDQRGNIITDVIISGENHVTWMQAMTLSLRARRKFGFVDGSIAKPTNPNGILDWDTVHSMIVSWILRSMDPKVASSIPLHDNATELWEYMQRRFCVANGSRIQQLKASIADCKQTESMSVDAYYTKLVGLYDELTRVLKPIPSCECHKCECGLALKLSKDRDDEIFHQFLIGLYSPNYGAVRTNLLSQQPFVINRAYQTFIQEEQSRALVRSTPVHESVQAFLVHSERGKGRYDHVDKSRLVCSHCKQKGHEVSGCFKFHGNPPWYEERLQSRNAAGVGTSGSSSGGGAGGSWWCWNHTWFQGGEGPRC